MNRLVGQAPLAGVHQQRSGRSKRQVRMQQETSGINVQDALKQQASVQGRCGDAYFGESTCHGALCRGPALLFMQRDMRFHGRDRRAVVLRKRHAEPAAPMAASWLA